MFGGSHQDGCTPRLRSRGMGPVAPFKTCGPYQSEIAMTEVLWNRMTAEELRRRAEENAIVLLPVASTEQHGPHLATGVDTFLGGEGCRRTALIVARSRSIVVAPVVW